METNTPAIVVKLLVDFFGLSEEAPHQIDLIKFVQFKDDFLEEVHTPIHDDGLSSIEDIDSDFGDDTPTYDKQQSLRHESSSSSYAS